MTIAQQVTDYIDNVGRKLKAAERVHYAIGQALTPDQQTAVSALIVKGPDHFIEWSRTEEGRAAIRELADKFTGRDKRAPSGDNRTSVAADSTPAAGSI